MGVQRLTGTHGEARPDEKMGRGMDRARRAAPDFPKTSAQNAIEKQRAAKKRRQRDG